MLIHLFAFEVVIYFSPAFSDSENVVRNKRSDEYIPCDFGWYYFREKCYKLRGRRPSERLHWDKAVERCRSNGGDLVSIQSQEEQDFIVSFLLMDVKATTWIGLNSREDESEFRWTDGSVFNYTNWDELSPSKVDRLGTKEPCVEMLIVPSIEFIGKWNDRQCDIPEAYICEMDANSRKRSPNPMRCSSEAGGGWKYGTSCYHVVRETASWRDAERHCKNVYNGHLVTVLDTLVDLFLGHILDNPRDELWIGIKIKNQLQQKWTSGWYVSYDGFSKEQINFVEGTCAARKKRKEWITIPCAERLPFVCEVSKETPPVLKPAPKGSICPIEFDGWRDLGGEYCYYFEKEKKHNFYEAQFECKRRGGELASIHSKEESEILHQFVKYIRRFGGYFIGLIRLFGREEEFGWTDGSPMDFENWRENEPNDESEKCVDALAFQDFKWNDNLCTLETYHICSVKKIIPNANIEEEEGCKSFCIYEQSHMYEMVNQSPDAKLCKTKCQT